MSAITTLPRLTDAQYAQALRRIKRRIQRQAAQRLAETVRATRTSHLDQTIATVPAWLGGAA